MPPTLISLNLQRIKFAASRNRKRVLYFTRHKLLTQENQWDGIRHFI